MKLHLPQGVLTAAFLLLGALSSDARNHIQNGTFASGISPWTISLSNGAAATLTTSGSTTWGLANITNPGSTTSKSNVVLKQTIAAKLISGTEYSISLRAKASAAKSIDVMIYSASNAILWAQYSVSLATTENTFNYTFAATADYTGACLAIRMGGSANAGDVYLDDVKVQNKLMWAPPTLVAPITLNFGATSNPTLAADDDDYIINIASVQRTTCVVLKGPWNATLGVEDPAGRHVRIIGGDVRVPIGGNFPAFNIKPGKVQRTVHIEGIKVSHVWDTANPTNSGQGDGVQNADPGTLLQVQNFRSVDLNGANASNHTDFIQPYKGSREVRVDGLTGSSSYQGLFLNADFNNNLKFVFRNLNMTADPEWYSGSFGGYMIWLDLKSNGGAGVSTNFKNVYVQSRPNRTLGYSVWPQVDDPNTTKRAVLAADGNSVSWPNWGVITGSVNKGTPPGGDFVTTTDAGLSYVSPGYHSASATALTMTQITSSAASFPASAASGTKVTRLDVSFTGAGHIIDLALTNNSSGRFSLSGRNILRTGTGTVAAGTNYSITVTATRRGSSPAQTITRTISLAAQ